MDKKGIATPIVIGIVVLIGLVAGAVYFSVSNTPEDMAEVGDEMIEEDSMMEEGDAMMESSFKGQVLAGSRSLLLDFNNEDYEKALKDKKIVVLYFYANWCPICRAEFPKTQSTFNKLSSDDVIGFRVNYNDNQTDNDEKGLASDFGVAYQHTKVILKDGERVLKSPETWEESRYLSEINLLLN